VDFGIQAKNRPTSPRLIGFGLDKMLFCAATTKSPILGLPLSAATTFIVAAVGGGSPLPQPTANACKSSSGNRVIDLSIGSDHAQIHAERN